MDRAELRGRVANTLAEVKQIPLSEDRKTIHEVARDLDYDAYQTIRRAERRKHVEKRIFEGKFGLPREEREGANHEADVVAWSEFIFNKFSTTPQGNKEEKKRAEKAFEKNLGYLPSHPQDIDTAVSVWKSRSMDEDGQVSEKSVYERAKNVLAQEVKKSWRMITPQQLSEFTRVYAHSQLAPDFGKSLLSSYFSGPMQPQEKAEAYHKYSLAALPLATDPAAIERAVAIGSFNSDILPVTSDFAMDCIALKSYGYVNSTKKAAVRNVNAGMIAFTVLGAFTPWDVQSSFIEQGRELLKNPLFSKKIEIGARQAFRDVGKNRATVSLSNHLNKIMPFADVSEALDSDPEFLNRATFISDDTGVVNRMVEASSYYPNSDPAIKGVMDKLAVEVARRKFQTTAEIFLRGYDVTNPITVSPTTPSGNYVDIVFPGEFIAQKKDILFQVLRDIGEEVETNKKFARNGQVLVKGKPVLYLYRSPGELQGDPHPLNALEVFGFPTPEVAEGETLQKANDRITSDVQRGQRRFINPRGVSIPFDQKVMQDLGYTKLEIAKHTEYPDKIQVQVFVGDVPYGVVLDKYYNFDFEGKSMDATVIMDSLRYTILSYLKPILCEEADSMPGGIGKELFKVFDRIPYLMLLEPGKKRTPRAINLCLENEGRDLLVMDAEKRLDRMQKGNPVPGDRQFTYVRPVHIETEEKLPPIEVKLPGIVKFGASN